MKIKRAFVIFSPPLFCNWLFKPKVWRDYVLGDVRTHWSPWLPAFHAQGPQHVEGWWYLLSSDRWFATCLAVWGSLLGSLYEPICLPWCRWGLNENSNKWHTRKTQIKQDEKGFWYIFGRTFQLFYKNCSFKPQVRMPLAHCTGM